MYRSRASGHCEPPTLGKPNAATCLKGGPEGERAIPFAVIQRWFIDNPGHAGVTVEVLVVRKVGQVEEWRGCILGYVVATGDVDANKKARQIADAKANENDCRLIDEVVEEGTAPLPGFTLYGYD